MSYEAYESTGESGSLSDPSTRTHHTFDYSVHLVDDSSAQAHFFHDAKRSQPPDTSKGESFHTVVKSGSGDQQDPGDFVSVSQCEIQCRTPEEVQPCGVFDLVVFVVGLCHGFVTIALALTWVFGPKEFWGHGMVITDFHDCSRVGKDVLVSGGSAVDAAVASAFCMCVHYPHVASLGGGGFMLIHHHKYPEMSRVVDFRETAPSRLTQATLDEGKIRSNTGQGFNGGVFVGVPGVPAGLFAAHKKFGRMRWKELIEPSIAMAKQSNTLNDHLATACVQRVYDQVWEVEGPTLMNKLMRSATSTVLYRNTELVETLELLAKQGIDAFYNGPIAGKIINSVMKESGVISKYDLKSYAVRWQKPLNMTWGNFTVLTSGPPSSGIGTMLSLGYLMLNPDVHKPSFGSPDALHLMMEASKLSLAEVGSLGDPNFAPYVKNRTEMLISPEMLEKESRHVRRRHTLQPGDAFPVIPEAAATEILVADNDDLYVSLVFGLNSYFGSRVEAGGFFLNNAMGTKRRYIFCC
jgi:gamma-glutamyltranspeptidase/glutathione hydrolase